MLLNNSVQGIIDGEYLNSEEKWVRCLGYQIPDFGPKMNEIDGITGPGD